MGLKYYVPSVDEYSAHVDRTMRVPRGEAVKYSVAKKDTTYFVVNQLGLTPYTWQSKLWDDLNNGDNVLAVTARQIGKTFAVAAWCLWALTYNSLPIDPDKKTHIILVSATEEQSKKIVSDIKKLMRVGDEHIYNITAKMEKDKNGNLVRVGGVQNFFTNQLNHSQEATNTKSTITFKNGCDLISLPPTDRARGYTGSILFIDEAAFIEEEDIYESTLKHIVAKTGNRMCMTTTPNGQQGFVYKLFDPDDELPHHSFSRLWIPYYALKQDDERLVLSRDKEKEVALALGNERSWMQEQEASFMTAVSAFFEADSVDKGVRKTLVFEERYDGPCDVAVDFGKVVSRTVFTFTALEREGDSNRIRMLYQYEYPPGEDLSLVDDIDACIRDRFPACQRVIFEDCPAAETFRQMAGKKPWNLVMFNPSADKLRKYVAFRSWLKQGKIVYPFVEELTKQMKGLIQEETPRTTKIYHGAGLRDDRVDSFVMSTMFFTEEKPRFRLWSVDDV